MVTHVTIHSIAENAEDCLEASLQYLCCYFLCQQYIEVFIILVAEF